MLAPWEMHVASSDAYWHQVRELNLDGADPKVVSFWPEGMDKSTPRHDEYLNNGTLLEFGPVRVVPRGEHPCADHLYNLYGPGIQVFEIRKMVPVIVHGQIGDESIQFRTSESESEAGATVPPNSFILESPMKPGQAYFNTPKKFGQLYDGKVIPGPVPLGMIDGVKKSWQQYGIRI